MVLGQVVSHHHHQPPPHQAQQGHYQPSHQQIHGPRQPPAATLILDDGSHYHGQKVLLDHNENELAPGAHAGHYHRMGGLVNGGKDPNWRQTRRRRKDDDGSSALAAGVHRLYVNANPHLNVAPVAGGPYNQHHQGPPPPLHHHQPHHAAPHYNSHSKPPPPASPNQINHNSHANASVVVRSGAGVGGGGVLAGGPGALTVVANPAQVLTAGPDQPILVQPGTTAVVLPAVEAAPPPPRSRREHHHGGGGRDHHHSSANNGSATSGSAAGAGGAGGAAGNQRTTPVQFDLAASAFPPLPGSSGTPSTVDTAQGSAILPSSQAKNLVSSTSMAGPGTRAAKEGGDVAAVSVKTGPGAAASAVAAGVGSVGGGATDNNRSSSGDAAAGAGETITATQAVNSATTSAWGDSLADVVKGTAKVTKVKPEARANSTSPPPPATTNNANGELIIYTLARSIE